MIFDESDDSIADGKGVAFLDEVCVFALEECFGAAGLVGYNCIDHGDLETVTGLDHTVFGCYHLHVNVVTVTEVLELLDFDELGLS
jgi:hypothetical protein